MNEIELLKAEVFPTWPEAKRRQIVIELGDKETVAKIEYGGRYYYGKSIRDKRDRNITETGIRNALNDLKRHINTFNKCVKQSNWIPDKHMYYWTISGITDPETTEEEPVAVFRKWIGSQLDYYLAGIQLIFRTEREAQKWARNREIAGRHKHNLLKKLP